MPSKNVIVGGAGIGGLVTAVQLAARGIQVQVLERASAPGGKMREVAIGPHRIDAGRTVFTMRWIFEEIFVEEVFADVGQRITSGWSRSKS